MKVISVNLSHKIFFSITYRNGTWLYNLFVIMVCTIFIMGVVILTYFINFVFIVYILLSDILLFFQSLFIIMPVIPGKPDYCMSLLSDLYSDDSEHHSHIPLCSDEKTIAVHSPILAQCSEILSNLLCNNTANNIDKIILPGFAAVLPDFVSLVYTGQARYLCRQDADLLAVLCTQLGLASSFSQDNITAERGGKVLSVSDHLKLDTVLECKESDENYYLRLPQSRVKRRDSNMTKKCQIFEGFKGRVQKEFNCSPVGKFEGNYDQDPQVPHYAQLPKSRLDFDKYTNFCHSETMQCKTFKIRNDYRIFDNLRKIESIEVEKNSKDMFVKPDDDKKVFYTCTKKYCKIPCPCHTCNTNIGQCLEHNIKHMDLFDEKEHAISVRSTEQTCTNESFFFRSYVLKYPGIPKSCSRCSKDLLHHKAYHFDFHWNCKFCKLYQYKLYPKTVDELHEREVKEKKWYQSVCPYCDTKFSGIYQRQKHVDSEHKHNRMSCPKCDRSFQCKQSLDYHLLTKHSKTTPPTHTCQICDKTFVAKVSLDNHNKFFHSDERKFSCNQCESTFKQRKNLNRHVFHVHGSNERKEDYWQDLPKILYECEHCKVKFTRKADLKAHIQKKHEHKKMFECDQCRSTFKYMKNLTRHKLEKHVPAKAEFECPDCDKKFSQKRNLKRHQLCHEK